jgi:hypothetical protein
LAGPGGPGEVVETLRLLQLSPQFRQPGLVGGLGGGIKQGPCIPQVPAYRQLAIAGPAPWSQGCRLSLLALGRLQVDGVELLAGMGQQPGQVAQALGVPQPTTAPS